VLILLLWRAGLRITEALALLESDLDRTRGAVLVRRGKGGKRREVGMARWAWDQLDPWLEIRRELPIGAMLCVIHGPTAARRWEASAARKQLHHAAAAAGVRRRFGPHQLRHAHAVEMAHEGPTTDRTPALDDERLSRRHARAARGCTRRARFGTRPGGVAFG
jgi:site-specific recombinase XerD